MPPERVVHFINRDDAADYLGNATITDQNLFGLTYLENFLGLSGVFLTNQVAKGTMIATPADNIRIFGVDFGELATSGLTYTVSDSGLIGVTHTPAYDHVSVETNVLARRDFLPRGEGLHREGNHHDQVRRPPWTNTRSRRSTSTASTPATRRPPTSASPPSCHGRAQSSARRSA